MTKTIKSETSNKHYFLTIDEATGQATDCACPDRFYRHHTCKHMAHFNQEVQKAATFMKLLARFDVRSQALVEAKRAAWWTFETLVA